MCSSIRSKFVVKYAILSKIIFSYTNNIKYYTEARTLYRLIEFILCFIIAFKFTKLYLNESLNDIQNTRSLLF